VGELHGGWEISLRLSLPPPPSTLFVFIHDTRKAALRSSLFYSAEADKQQTIPGDSMKQKKSKLIAFSLSFSSASEHYWLRYQILPPRWINKDGWMPNEWLRPALLSGIIEKYHVVTIYHDIGEKIEKSEQWSGALVDEDETRRSCRREEEVSLARQRWGYEESFKSIKFH
jgi:hypothetical protein